MRRFKNPVLVAEFISPEETFDPRDRVHRQKTLCTSNFHAINIIADYVLRHDPFQKKDLIPLGGILVRLDNYNRLDRLYGPQVMS